jgi:transcription initiation factor TFIIB
MYKTHSCERADATERADTSADESDGSICPECKANIVYDLEPAEHRCESCGLVVTTEAIDHGPEWRAVTSEEKDSRSRVGAPTTHRLHNKGLSTTIDWRNEDASGRSLYTRQRKLMKRLRTWDERFRTKSNQERNLKHALGEIDQMASTLGLPEHVRETAGVIYRRVLEEELLPGRSIEGMATAYLYGAARQAGVPRSLSEVRM